ncbi:MAG: LuxR C-terminal-related transcriptional regulator [Acidimicrobiales bacterium]
MEVEAVTIEPFDAVFGSLNPPSRPRSARILVLDDDLLMAEALVFALVQRGFSARFAVPATLDHLRDAILWVPDLAILDADLVDGDPIEFVRFLVGSRVAVAVMGRSNNRQLLHQCVDAGAVARIESSVALEDLVHMLGSLISEGKVPTREPASTNCQMPRGVRSPFAILTPREQSVLAELMNGLTADAIAKNAWVAVSTVRSQIKSILQKLGVNSQLAAVALARQAGWNYQPAPRPRVLDREDNAPLAG